MFCFCVDVDFWRLSVVNKARSSGFLFCWGAFLVETRKGQTTIPALLREKFGIGEGSRLEVVETADGILFKPVKSTVDLAGSGAGFASPEEMKRVLDRIRDLDVY